MGNLLMVKKNLWKLSKYLIYLKIYLKNITIFSNFKVADMHEWISVWLYNEFRALHKICEYPILQKDNRQCNCKQINN